MYILIVHMWHILHKTIFNKNNLNLWKTWLSDLDSNQDDNAQNVAAYR